MKIGSRRTLLVVGWVAVLGLLVTGYWLYGMFAYDHHFERLEYVSVWSEVNDTRCTIHVTVKNIGAAYLTPDAIHLYTPAYGRIAQENTRFPEMTISITNGWNATLRPGETRSFDIAVPYNRAPFTPSATIPLTIQTVAGTEFSLTVTLPPAAEKMNMLVVSTVALGAGGAIAVAAIILVLRTMKRPLRITRTEVR